MLALPASAESDLWDAETSATLHDNASFDTTTFTDRGTVIKDSLNWNNYNLLTSALSTPITGKLVNISFDFYSASNYLNGTPSFYIKTYNSAPGDFKGTDYAIGFYAYDSTGSAAGEGRFSYYGNSSRLNSEPIDSASGNWVNGYMENVEKGKWYHVDSVYDLSEKTVSHYVDGEKLGTAMAPNAIYGVAVYAIHNNTSAGISYFDNFKISEVKADSLTWTAVTEASDDSFLINFSHPVNSFSKDAVSVVDMETLADATVSSVERIKATSWRVNLATAKMNNEYRVKINGITSDFGTTALKDTAYANTGKVPVYNAEKSVASYTFDDLSAIPSWWNSRISGTSNGVAGEETKYFIETTADGENPQKRLRIQNVGDWTETATLGMAGVGTQLSLPENAKSVEIEFDAAYKKDTTLLPFDAVRRTERTNDSTNYETGAFGTVQLALGNSYSYKHVMNFGSSKLYGNNIWGSAQSTMLVSGVTLTNNLSDLKTYKLVYDVANAKLTAYCEGTEAYTITYDKGTKLYGIAFLTMLSNKEGAAAQSSAVLGADSNTLVVDNIKVKAIYDDITSFGVKKVRYNGTQSNISIISENLGADDFSAYDTKGDAGSNKTNENDYETASSGAWTRYGHEKSGAWWGCGSYVNKSGQLNIDTFQSATPIEMGAVRRVKADSSAVKTDVLNVNFDAAYNAIEAAGDSSFTLYAGEYPIFNISRTEVSLYDEQLVDEKLLVAANEGGVTNLKNINLAFDFENSEIKLRYGNAVKTTTMYEDLVSDGISTLKFIVNNTVTTEDNGTNGNCTFVMDNYKAELLKKDLTTPTYIQSADAYENIVPTTTSVDIEFTAALKEATVSGIGITDASGNSVAYTPSLSADKKTLTLAVELKANEEYTIAVPVSVKSEDEVANGRAYAFAVRTNSPIKLYDALGAEMTSAQLATAAYANVKVLTTPPTTGIGKCAYVCAIYDKTNDILKTAKLAEITYDSDDVIEYNGDINIMPNEYARLYLWEYNGNLSPICTDYTVGK